MTFPADREGAATAGIPSAGSPVRSPDGSADRADASAEAATAQVADWLRAFDAALTRRDVDAACALFHADGHWRDLVAFSWNIVTLEGRRAIGEMLGAQLDAIDPADWSIDGAATRGMFLSPEALSGERDPGDTDRSSTVVEAWLRFDTATARANGHLRLADGKCLTLLTAITELEGFEERRGRGRESGLRHGATRHRVHWAARRRAAEAALGDSEQPYVVIIGGGQGGIALAARLRRLDVPTIVLERSPRAGDSWRDRYDSLVLHDPVWYDHMPYLPFPDDWPVFTPKDKLGDWLEMYTKVMELNYWGSSECLSAEFDDAADRWRVRVRRDGTEVVLEPHQLVFATGAYGPPLELELPGRERFEGETMHSSAYRGGDAWSAKRCVVVGAASSAHDVCVDLWEHGAEVTMVQRSPSIVAKSETLMELGFGPLYSERALEAGIDTDTADMLAASIPYRLMPALHRPVWREIRRRDADYYARLSGSGFLHDFGVDDSGLMMKALRSAAGYYIDVGATELIAGGEIAVRSGVSATAFTADAIRLSDGTSLAADLVVFAIGFGSMNGWVAELASPEMADRVGPCWGLGSGTPGDPGPWQGELRNMWKPTAQRGLWFHGGNLHLSRHYSLYLSLQLKARMEGLETPVFPREAGDARAAEGAAGRGP